MFCTTKIKLKFLVKHGRISRVISLLFFTLIQSLSCDIKKLKDGFAYYLESVLFIFIYNLLRFRGVKT